MASDADFILKAMVAMAAADDRLDAREVHLIQDVYLEQTGREVDVSGVMMAVQAYATKRDALGELANAAGGMSRDTKEAIISAAIAMLLANERVNKGESDTLRAIATALQIAETELQAILAKTGRDLGEESGR